MPVEDGQGKVLYVWFDAPIGYIASTKQWCDANQEDPDDWWKSDECEVHHFIGKDITYFHTLFWPGMLKSAGFRLPTKVHIHGFLTVGGEYGDDLLALAKWNAACQIANREGLMRLAQIKAILTSNRDRLPEQLSFPSDLLPQDHENIRGPKDFH